MQALQLTEEQKAQHKKAFDLLDKDKSGAISTDELGAAMRSIGLDPSDELLKEMIKSVDADDSKTLSFEEFQAMMFKEMNKAKMEEIWEMFREYDTDNDGTITAEDLHRLFQSDQFKTEGPQVESDDVIIQKMFKEADINKDGKINIEGECKHCM